MRVDTPTGTWHVRRRWAPRHLGADTIFGRFRRRNRRMRKESIDLADVADPGCLPDLGQSIAVALLVVVAIVFMIFVGIPFLVALGELLIILVLALAGLVGRVLFRRPWTVDAVSPDGDHTTWAVVGWQASGAARQFIADRLAGTGTVPTDDAVRGQL